MKSPAQLASPLLRWYRSQKRSLPWRRTKDPYAIWLSEIMLQQTRVATVIPYYERFLSKFPDVSALAQSSEDEVLKMWAGLGYYSRGRNLRKAAQFVVRECDGEFPRSAAELRRLPGIGPYTSNAIGSIAFDESVAVIDGNVERVFARLFALQGPPKSTPTRKRLEELTAAAVPREHSGDYNQAVMELGALLCTPKSPRCEECPLQSHCEAYAQDAVGRYPEPSERRRSEVQHWVAALATTPRGAVLHRTEDAELLAGHWGVSLTQASGKTPPKAAKIQKLAQELFRQTYDQEPEAGEVLPAVQHGITFRKLIVHPVRFEIPRSPGRNFRIQPFSRTDELPVLFRKIIRALEKKHAKS